MRSFWVVALAAGVVVGVRAASADGGAARGRVVDASSGAGVAGATVGSDAGTVVTGRDGGFVLPGGAGDALFVHAEGYAPMLTAAGGAGPIRIELAETRGAVEIIEVSGKAPDLAAPTSYSLGRDQVRALPGGANDILRAVQTLPGVTRISYGLGGLVLRGASTGENGVYLDGIEVPVAFHFGGITSFYPSALLDEVVVRPGGADVAFGRNVGGHVELRARAPRADRWRVGGEISVFDAASVAEGPAPGGGAIALGLRRSYADAYLPALLPDEDEGFPRYYDGQLRWDREVAGGTVTGMAFFSDDRIGGEGSTYFRQAFARASLRYRKQRGDTTVTVMPWAGWGRLRLDLVVVADDEVTQRTQVDRAPLGLRADVVRDTGWGHLAAGLDLQLARVELESSNDQASMPRREVGSGWFANLGAWAEARWRIDDGKLTVKPGVRIDRIEVAERTVVEPRVVFTHELTRWLTLREELGVYHQAPASMPSTNPGAPRADPEPLSRGVHASLGARVELPASTVVSITGYHAVVAGPPVEEPPGAPMSTGLGIVLDNLIAEELGAVRGGRSRRRGIELSMQRRTERWLAWLAYTVSRSEHHDGAISLDGWVPESLDQPHNISVVVSVRLGHWLLGVRGRWSSGLPFTPLERGSGDTFDGATSEWGPRNSERLREFNSLDLRVDHAWRRAWGTVNAYLDVQNVTNALNPEGIYYEDGQAKVMPGLPVLPLIGVSYHPPE